MTLAIRPPDWMLDALCDQVLRQRSHAGGHVALSGGESGEWTLRLLDPAKAATILRAHGIAADGGCVTLPPLRDDLLAALVQQLAMNGAGVVELTPHTKTLEEIFLSLTANEEAD